MSLKPPDAAQLWREVEEHLAPTFSLWSSDRVVIFYLLRASRLAGRRVILMPARTLSRATLLSRSTVRIALRRLAARGIIRVLKRNYSGLQIEVKLPREIPGCISTSRLPDGRSLDALDFWSSRVRRSAIYRRDGHRCFYCLRRLRPDARVIDHVIPRASAAAAHHLALTAKGPSTGASWRRNASSHAGGAPAVAKRRAFLLPMSAAIARRRPDRPLPAPSNVNRARDAAPQIRGSAPTRRPSTFQPSGLSTFSPSRAPKRLAADHALVPANLKRLAANAPYNFLNSYRNLVACCAACNMAKRDRPAADHLRNLFRANLLTASELGDRLDALHQLANGHIKPSLPPRRTSP
ncbi:MAG: hypothetical protein ACRD5G_00995 [Candidatus Acidiferrales bacterium]